MYNRTQVEWICSSGWDTFLADNSEKLPQLVGGAFQPALGGLKPATYIWLSAKIANSFAATPLH